jgi:hypothetical protein
MIRGKRRLIFMLAFLAGVIAAEIAIKGGLSTNAQVTLVAGIVTYIGGDSYVKGKDDERKQP